MVDRVLACWLQMQHASLQLAMATDRPAEQREYYERRAEAAERRYIAAVSLLSRVRLLLSGIADSPQGKAHLSADGPQAKKKVPLQDKRPAVIAFAR